MRICDVGGGIGLLKILFVGLLWEGGTRCNDFLIIGQCFALQQRLTLAREASVVVRCKRLLLFCNGCEGGSIRCDDPSVLRHKGLSEYLRYLKRKVWQFMIRNSLVAIQLPLAREPRGLVQDERFVIVYNYCENDKVQCKISI